MHHVILGAGPAGVVAAETLRKLDSKCKITLVGGEGEPPYSRMAIPYLLSGDIKEGGTYLRQDKKHYDDLDIKYVQANAKSVDSKAKTVALDGGKDLKYDTLLIATGSSPLQPPVKGLDLPGVSTCWTLEDSRKILKTAKKGDSVVLMGAGFIGSIILEALVKMGVKLTVVEMGDRMVPRMMDDTAGNMLKRWCEDQGVTVLTGAKIEKISGDKKGLQVTVSNGDKLDAKLVVVAAGVAPNIDFLKKSGVKTGTGVIVDEHLATSAPDVYAAGDVAEARDLSTGEWDVMAIQPVAVEHGYLAAQNMAGVPTPHQGSLNMNVLDTLGLVSSSFGSWQGVKGGDSAKLVDEDGFRYLRLEFSGDQLVGGQAVGMTENIGVMRGLIQTGYHLGDWKDKLMKSPQRLTEAYVAASQGVTHV
jgi:NAD(P)H-nitrite reductase large subunit